MPCYSPLSAWKGGFTASGKRELLFKRPKIDSASLFQLKLPCGQCIGCRLERSRQWAMRCVHEASLYPLNCFVTLTYDRDSVPRSGSLVKRDFQLFMKRLRKFAGVSKPGLRFFSCGEYGESLGRPHYHAIIFNYDFTDKYIFRKSERGDSLYRSPSLESLWTLGNSMIGSMSFESAAYVARYCLKKVTGKNADEHYVNKSTGELRVPEFTLMSRRPGIGRGWYDKFKSDIFPRDYAIMRGMKVPVPKFYDKCLDVDDPAGLAALKLSRVGRACKSDPTGFGEHGDIRLRVKETVKIAQMRSLSRTLEV